MIFIELLFFVVERRLRSSKKTISMKRWQRIYFIQTDIASVGERQWIAAKRTG